ncbi:MAG: hypothetical protein QM681_19625 [Novosphingobium sp.]
MKNASLNGKPSMPSAWSAQVHGPVQRMTAEEARKERISWIALGVFGFATGIVLFLAFAHACGPVPA